MNEKESKSKEKGSASKKTRRNKNTVPTIGTRTTRARRRKESSDEYTLPEVIPCNQFPQVQVKQSFESQNTRLILQVPLSSFVGDEFQQIQTTRVENLPLQVRISREKESIACGFRLPEDIITQEGQESWIVVHGKYSWLGESSVTNKPIKSIRKAVGGQKWQEIGWIKMGPIHSDLFVSLTLRAEQEQNEQFCGLVNQGNTCYMNSYLQMLFHLPYFRYLSSDCRRLIFSAEVREPDKFPATLQMLFYRLLNEQKAVSPEELIRSFGWSKKEAQVQQDVQEFSCLFFDILERKVDVLKPPGHIHGIGELFCGELTHYIQCCHVGTNRKPRKVLRSSHSPGTDHFPGTRRLRFRAGTGRRQLLPNRLLWTPVSQKSQIYQGLFISKLPPVLMLQLKRFQYNYFNESNQKILDECKYPQQMDFARWTNKPQISTPYVLYAVLVHQGSYASSGHYYVLIKNKNKWIKFNDESVHNGSRERALHYNYGGYSQAIEYNAKQMRIQNKQVQNKATAYMLVYINKQLYPTLFQELKEDFPSWLIEQTKWRHQMEEEKKIRKQSICDIPVLRWKKYFQQHTITSLGFIDRQSLAQTIDQKIELVPKSQRVDEWLKQLKSEGQDRSVYIYWTVQDRQVMINAQAKSDKFVRELFSQISDPMVIFAPIHADNSQYLVITKQFKKNGEEDDFKYGKLMTFKKESTIKELYSFISHGYGQANNNSYYIQDRKQGLIPLTKTDNSLLPVPSPTRNQLLVIAIQLLQTSQKSGSIQDWYKQQMDSITVTFKTQSNKDYDWFLQLNKNQTIKEIREIIFEQIISQKQQFQSASNIVIKYKQKKNSKLLIQAHNNDQLKDILKVDKIIYFSYSSLKIDQRKTQKQLFFYYRIPGQLRLSQQQTIVVQKKTQNSILQMICSSPHIQEELPQKMNCGYRLFLLSKDRSYINQSVDQNGYVYKKGQLLSVLEKQKYSSLVLEQYQLDQRKENLINVYIHHVTKTGQKIGMPRWEYITPNILLSKLKYLILDQISNDIVEFQGKTYPVNPGKIRLLAYIKDWSRAEELPEPSELMDEPSIPEQTVQGKYGTPRSLRVGIVHNSIAKSIQALKLNVE